MADSGDSSVKVSRGAGPSGFDGFVSGAKLPVILFALAIALLFFASLDTVRYGLDVASRAYFGSVVVIWQYPAEWPMGAFFGRMWLPLPGGPVVAMALLFNLGFAGWRAVRESAGWSFEPVSLAVIHVGVAGVVLGYLAVLPGSPYAKGTVIGGATIAVVGLVMRYGRVLAIRAKEAVQVPEPGPKPRRGGILSSRWYFPVLLGVAAGLLFCSFENRVDLVAAFDSKKVELLPVLLYLASVLAVAFSMRRGDGAGRWAALLRSLPLSFLSAGVAVHTLLLVLMIAIRRLPPVVDLYSSFVFAGWCGGLIAYFVEHRRKSGMAGVVAALVASAALAVAYGLGNSFDYAPSAAVVSRFWLTLHVATIVCGCGAVLLAVAAADALLAGRRFGMGDGAAQVLERLLNGAWAAGLVFVAAGVLMGGLWAEGAWGRFWGWDPKENGALILLLWLALALHARRAGWVREGGFAALAALGGVALAWSWMGTNLLGAGLHSYALAGAGGRFVGAYVILQLAWVVLFRLGAKKKN